MASPRPRNNATYHAPPPTAPGGSAVAKFVPGTKVQVGSHRVVIEKYLSEGGFAHVYVVRDPASTVSQTLVLKRVAVPDKETLSEMRTEVETMKKLKGHRHIVTYIDSHASQIKGGGYEVFLLMEHCAGGGLIDFMNTRLQNRLTEPEILKIISDVAEGVACMHYLKPPLLHRDLKVENVLISSKGALPLYKLCDFGSSAPPRPAATNAAEGRLIEDDVQRHTTLQYRSPEMIDVYRKRPIDEKSDIWALGVLLYKLCYYTTPFEVQGQMAILNATFKYPAYPRFSDNLKLLIARMLSESPSKRPNIHQVMQDICKMRGTEVPIPDIYAQRTGAEARDMQRLPNPEVDVEIRPVVGANKISPIRIKSTIPDVTPMRRGRPIATVAQNASSADKAKPISSTGSAFAAPDPSSTVSDITAVTTSSARFPAIGEFGILKNEKNKYRFDAEHAAARTSKIEGLDTRLVHALADNAFVPTESSSLSAAEPKLAPLILKTSGAPTPVNAAIRQQAARSGSAHRPSMVSTGTMTSPTTSPSNSKSAKRVDPPIFRVPRSSPRPDNPSRPLRRSSSSTSRLLDGQHSDSSKKDFYPRATISSRPSFERLHAKDAVPKSLAHFDEPVSLPRSEAQLKLFDIGEAESAIDETTIVSDLEYLRTMEHEKHDHRHSSHHHDHHKHNSMLPESQTRGEQSSLGRLSDKSREAPENEKTSPHFPHLHVRRVFSPRSGHKDVLGTDNFGENDTHAIEETEDISPEVRRELERHHVNIEEKRVTEAALAYRQQANSGSGRGGRRNSSAILKSSAIQNRVRNLLDESNRTISVKKTASGYGKYTELEAVSSDTSVVAPQPEKQTTPSIMREVPDRDVMTASAPADLAVSEEQHNNPRKLSSTAINGSSRTRTKPSAPPKPVALRTGVGARTPNAQVTTSSNVPAEVNEDWEQEFSKRYPSLSLDMVEQEIMPANMPQRRLASIKTRNV